MGEGFAGYKAFAIAVLVLAFVGVTAPDLGSNFDPLRVHVDHKGSGSNSGSGSGSTSGGSTGSTTGSGTGSGSTSSGTTNPLYPEDSAIASNFNVSSYLQPSWGTGKIAADNGSDPVGAFRFICGAGQVSYDDPIVYPNQPGASHLHQYYGNSSANAYSTYASLRQNGEATCGNKVNRSAYWMPALLDGKGHVVQPDDVSIYYKRLPASNPKCNDPSRTDLQAQGICIPLPNGLRFTYGYDMLTGTPPTGHHHFACVIPNKPGGSYNTLADLVAAGCPAGAHIEAMIVAPDCWDGVNLDSPNHRSHMAYASDGNWGYLRCPADHPFYIPQFALGAFYSVAAGDDLKLWHFSSDEMVPGVPAGTTFHADWFGAWDNTVEAMWIDNCINKHLNCSGGDLGNGLQIIGGAHPSYGWTNPNRLVPIPSR